MIDMSYKVIEHLVLTNIALHTAKNEMSIVCPDLYL